MADLRRDIWSAGGLVATDEKNEEGSGAGGVGGGAESEGEARGVSDEAEARSVKGGAGGVRVVLGPGGGGEAAVAVAGSGARSGGGGGYRHGFENECRGGGVRRGVYYSIPCSLPTSTGVCAVGMGAAGGGVR